MRGNIFYEVKYLYIVSCIGVLGLSFVLSHCGLYWNEISDKLAKQGAVKNMSDIPYSNLLLSSHEITSILEKTVYKQIGKKVNLRYLLPNMFRKSNIQVTSKFMEN